MDILNVFKKLRDDLKVWVTNNLNALNTKIDEKTVPIDNELSSTSTNPVQNKVIKQAIDNIPTFSGNYNDLTNAPDISEDGSGNMVITDESGNIIFKADADGIHTTAVSLNGEAAATEKYVDDAVANIDIPEVDFTGYATEEYVTEEIAKIPPTDLTGYATEGYVNEAIAAIPETDFTGYATEDFVTTAVESAKEELSESIVAESDEWKVVDEAGNIIFSVDATGAHTTELTLNGESAATESYVDDAIANIEFPTTDLTDYATKKYVDDAVDGIEIPSLDGYATETYVDNKVADLVNSAPEALNTLGELATALKNHEDAYDALLETVGGKATKEELNNLKDELSESIVSEADELKVVDDGGNIIFSVDAEGAHTTSMTLNGQSVKNMIDDKVDKVDGKGLSTNDFTNEYKTKLDNINEGGGGGTSVLDSLLSLSGTNKKTLNMNDCSVDAAADYAVVGGTNDKTVISNILGSLASTSVSVAKPVVNADCGISFGSGTVVNSTGGNALGVWNTSGVKGFYWESVSKTADNKYQIILSNTQDTVGTYYLSDSAFQEAINKNTLTDISSYGWAKDDIISIVNNNKYPACAKISSISSITYSYTATVLISSKTKTATRVAIVVDSLPFDERASVTLRAPDDYTIYACYEKSEVTGVNSRWYPRSGVVELGWAGTAFGVENLVTGSGGFVGGWNNWQAGDFGATFGRDNISNYSGLTAGMDNENITPCSAVFGTQNKTQYNPSSGNGNGNNLVCGEDNITSAWNAAAIGRQLRATTNAQLAAGQFNAVTDERATFVVGNGNVTSDPVQEGDEVVDGYKVVRSNAFIVYHSGRIEAGKQTQSTDSDLTLVTNKYLKDSIASTIIPGLTEGDQTSGSNNVRIGINNTFEKFSSDAGMGTGISCSESLIVGNGNQANGNQVFIAGYQNKVNVNQGVALGEGNKVTGAQGFAANFKNTVAGASGAAFGESNTVNGQNSAAFGLRNKVLVATGSSNNGKNNIIGGEDNTSSNWNNAAFGRCLDADTSALTVVGQFNKTPSARAMFIVGNGNVNITGVEQTTTTNQTETAYSRRNAFVAYYDGRCAVGTAPTEDMDVVNLAYLKNYLLDKEW